MNINFTDINGVSSHSIEYTSRFELKISVQALEYAVDISSEQKAHKMHAVVSAMYGLAQKIDQATNWLEDDEIREIVRPARLIYGEAPFVKRLQTWPRGYPGDFETIEMMMSGKSHLDPSHRAYWIDWYALNTPIANQHRNKLTFQREQIAKGLQAGGSILSVGCGGGADLTEISGLRGQNISISLVDIDEDALALATERAGWAEEVSAIHGDGLRALRSMTQKFDRIVFGGLFDYLDDRAIRLLLKIAYEKLLQPGGRILFTNLSTNSTYDVWLEFLASWHMTYRTQAKIVDLVTSANIPEERLTIKLDATGLSLLCEIEG